MVLDVLGSEVVVVVATLSVGREEVRVFESKVSAEVVGHQGAQASERRMHREPLEPILHLLVGVEWLLHSHTSLSAASATTASVVCAGTHNVRPKSRA